MFEVVGKIVRQRRIELGLTIAQLAEKAGVSDSYVSSIELGSVQNARIAKLNDLAQALDIKLGDLFTSRNLSDSYTIELIEYLSTLPDERRAQISKSVLALIKP